MFSHVNAAAWVQIPQASPVGGKRWVTIIIVSAVDRFVCTPVIRVEILKIAVRRPTPSTVVGAPFLAIDRLVRELNRAARAVRAREGSSTGTQHRGSRRCSAKVSRVPTTAAHTLRGSKISCGPPLVAFLRLRGVMPIL